MPKLPAINAKKVISTLGEFGFVIHRIIGSHHVLIKDESTVVVPVHGNEPLPTGTLIAILKQSGIAREDFVKMTKPKSKR